MLRCTALAFLFLEGTALGLSVPFLGCLGCPPCRLGLLSCFVVGKKKKQKLYLGPVEGQIITCLFYSSIFNVITIIILIGKLLLILTLFMIKFTL